MGGRGAVSGARKEYTAAGGAKLGKPSKELDKNILRGKMGAKTQDEATKAFVNMHKNSDHEYMAIVNRNGDISKYYEGQKSSVGYDGRAVHTGSLTIHNHPSGNGIPSSQDMFSFSKDSSRTAVVTGTKITTSISKNQKTFNRTGFTQNVVSRMAKNENLFKNNKISYDFMLRMNHNILLSNQKKYHYKYGS